MSLPLSVLRQKRIIQGATAQIRAYRQQLETLRSERDALMEQNQALSRKLGIARTLLDLQEESARIRYERR